MSDVWMFLHSGSRGIGQLFGLGVHQSCASSDATNSRSIRRTPTWHICQKGLSSLEITCKDLMWAQNFALLNREEMLAEYVTGFANAPLFRTMLVTASILCVPQLSLSRTTTSGGTYGSAGSAPSWPETLIWALITGLDGHRVLCCEGKGLRIGATVDPAWRRQEVLVPSFAKAVHSGRFLTAT